MSIKFKMHRFVRVFGIVIVGVVIYMLIKLQSLTIELNWLNRFVMKLNKTMTEMKSKHEYLNDPVPHHVFDTMLGHAFPTDEESGGTSIESRMHLQNQVDPQLRFEILEPEPVLPPILAPNYMVHPHLGESSSFIPVLNQALDTMMFISNSENPNRLEPDTELMLVSEHVSNPETSIGLKSDAEFEPSDTVSILELPLSSPAPAPSNTEPIPLDTMSTSELARSDLTPSDIVPDPSDTPSTLHVSDSTLEPTRFDDTFTPAINVESDVPDTVPTSTHNHQEPISSETNLSKADLVVKFTSEPDVTPISKTKMTTSMSKVPKSRPVSKSKTKKSENAAEKATTVKSRKKPSDLKTDIEVVILSV